MDESSLSQPEKRGSYEKTLEVKFFPRNFVEVISRQQSVSVLETELPQGAELKSAGLG